MFIIRIAELNIKIHNKYNYVKKLCKNYIVKANSIDIEIYTNKEEIEEERKFLNYRYNNAYSEGSCIYKKICNEMIKYNKFFLHSSVVEVDGKSYCFSADSGVGKSTHTTLWLDYFKERAKIINGDKPILEVTQTGLIAYGTPWCGKEGLNTNTSSPVRAICFLERGKKNEITQLKKNEILIRLVNQLEFPKQKESVEKLLNIIDYLIDNIDFYLLKCNISTHAVKIAYTKMNKGEVMKLKEGLVIRKFKNDYLIIATGKLTKEFPRALIVNQAGADMFNLLKKETTKEKMTKELLKKYKSSEKEITENIDIFLNMLRNEHILDE